MIEDAIIEDALKSTRTLHRLIMIVSIVTIAFSLPLYPPKEEVAQKYAIDALINSNFLAYDQFVAERVEAFRQEKLVPIGDALNEKIDSGEYLAFDLDDLGETFSQPLHVGKLLIEELALSDISGATLEKLDSINVLCLSCDVQVAVPRMQELTKKIEDFLSENVAGKKRYFGVGKRITEIRVSFPGDQEIRIQSFLPQSDTIGTLNFKIVDAMGKTEAFTVLFPADVVTLPESSFIHWLTTKLANKDKMAESVSIDSNRVVFAPTLDKTPPGLRQKKLGILHQDLTKEIASKAPEKQTVNILGVQVRGLLIVVASPLTLLILSYYFANHTGHLVRLGKKNSEAFKSFLWMPLSIQSDIPLFVFSKAESGYRISGWVLETILSIIILPIASLVILYCQLSQFGSIDLWPSLIFLFGGIGVIMFGRRSFGNIKTVRGIETY